MDRPDLLTQIASRADAVRVRNVINPLLWLSAVTLPCGIGGAWLFREQAAFAAPILATGLLAPLSGIVAYFYFMARDPDRLQSEEYLIEQQRLMLSHKGSTAKEDADLLSPTRNPELFSTRDQSDG